VSVMSGTVYKREAGVSCELGGGSSGAETFLARFTLHPEASRVPVTCEAERFAVQAAVHLALLPL
jgi:hypothetical protein